MDDFGELSRYRAANAKLKPPAPGDKRVVFLGMNPGPFGMAQTGVPPLTGRSR